jgi:acyl carrier protein phosphodiesterase
MNYLGHLYLAGNDNESIVGNFLGDFIKGKIENSHFSENIQSGITLHRKIDKAADNQIISLLNDNYVNFEQRRYAGITFDLACDHFLAKHWGNFHHDNVDLFAANTINVLKSQEFLFPEKGKQVLNRMIQYQWLENYQHLDFVEQVFSGIHKRFPRDNSIHLGFMDLKNNYLPLEESCLNFVTQLQKELLE